ncbi:hypothetical protein ccbrp13_56260 [Ktedonobacteria bacterium brp13]|nr:hypothetical protein ccbrp13_56260 [Ktedonobacteria bacterium brp13]
MANIHLSPMLNELLRTARYMIDVNVAAGKKELAVYWSGKALQVTNTGCIEALEDKEVYADEVFVYVDLSGEMNNPANKEKQRKLELDLLAGSPLYNDVVELLKKHLSDGVK